MRKILDACSLIMKWLAITCLFSIFFVVVIQVFSRYFLPTTPSWTEELSRFLYVHAIGFSVPLAIRSDLLVRVDFVESFFSTSMIIYQKLFNRIIALAISIIFLYTSYYFFISGTIETSVALVWPMAVPFSSVFFSGIFMSVFSVEKLVEDIFNLKLSK